MLRIGLVCYAQQKASHARCLDRNFKLLRLWNPLTGEFRSASQNSPEAASHFDNEDNLSPLELYTAQIKAGELTEDPHQRRVVEKLEEVHHNLQVIWTCDSEYLALTA